MTAMAARPTPAIQIVQRAAQHANAPADLLQRQRAAGRAHLFSGTKKPLDTNHWPTTTRLKIANATIATAG